MSKPEEQSVDDIISSIRKIMDDDGVGVTPVKTASEPRPMAPPEPPRPNAPPPQGGASGMPTPQPRVSTPHAAPSMPTAPGNQSAPAPRPMPPPSAVPSGSALPHDGRPGADRFASPPPPPPAAPTPTAPAAGPAPAPPMPQSPSVPGPATAANAAPAPKPGLPPQRPRPAKAAGQMVNLEASAPEATVPFAPVRKDLPPPPPPPPGGAFGQRSRMGMLPDARPMSDEPDLDGGPKATAQPDVASAQTSHDHDSEAASETTSLEPAPTQTSLESKDHEVGSLGAPEPVAALDTPSPVEGSDRAGRTEPSFSPINLSGLPELDAGSVADEPEEAEAQSDDAVAEETVNPVGEAAGIEEPLPIADTADADDGVEASQDVARFEQDAQADVPDTGRDEALSAQDEDVVVPIPVPVAPIANTAPEPEAPVVEAAAASTVSGLEAAVTGMLKPMLKDWIDENMPRIVEKVAREELRGGSGDGRGKGDDSTD